MKEYASQNNYVNYLHANRYYIRYPCVQMHVDQISFRLQDDFS